MKTRLFFALFLAVLLAVLMIPTGAALAAPQASDVEPAGGARPAAAEPPSNVEAKSLTQQSPAVQIAIGIVGVLFGCLAFAPLALADRTTHERG